jgi:hypothetical protein
MEVSSAGMCRPSGTHLINLSLPGTDVPGYRLFRPFGTALLPPVNDASKSRPGPPTHPFVRASFASPGELECLLYVSFACPELNFQEAE